MLRQTLPSDLTDLAPRLTQTDLKEVEVLTGLGPLEALAGGLFRGSSCMTGLDSETGEIVCVFGVVPYNEMVGSVWFLTSDLIHKPNNKRTLVRLARGWLDEQNARYSVLTNFVLESNDVHLRLVRHFGFTLGDPLEISGSSERAIPIERKQTCALLQS